MTIMEDSKIERILNDIEEEEMEQRRKEYLYYKDMEHRKSRAGYYEDGVYIRIDNYTAA